MLLKLYRISTLRVIGFFKVSITLDSILSIPMTSRRQSVSSDKEVSSFASMIAQKTELNKPAKETNPETLQYHKLPEQQKPDNIKKSKQQPSPQEQVAEVTSDDGIVADIETDSIIPGLEDTQLTSTELCLALQDTSESETQTPAVILAPISSITHSEKSIITEEDQLDEGFSDATSDDQIAEALIQTEDPITTATTQLPVQDFALKTEDTIEGLETLSAIPTLVENVTLPITSENSNIDTPKSIIITSQPNVIVDTTPTPSADILITEIETTDISLARQLSNSNVILKESSNTGQDISKAAIVTKTAEIISSTEPKQALSTEKQLQQNGNTQTLEINNVSVATAPQTQAPIALSENLKSIIQSVEVTNISIHLPETSHVHSQDMSSSQDFLDNHQTQDNGVDQLLSESLDNNSNGIFKISTEDLSSLTATNFKTEISQSRSSGAILDQISTSIDTNAKILNSKGTLTITLNPSESLGTVEVRFERGLDNVLRITLTVEKQDTFDVIAAGKKEIIASLEKVSGMDEASFTFNLEKGNHGHSQYEEQKNHFLFLGDQSDGSRTKSEILQKTTSYSSTMGYNQGDTTVNITL